MFNELVFCPPYLRSSCFCVFFFPLLGRRRYEFVLQARLLLQGTPASEILAGWREMLPATMERWALERSALVKALASTRDAWIERDPRGWASSNRLYPPMGAAVGALASCKLAYVVTTKQARYARLILEDLAGVKLGEDRVISVEATGKPKGEVLEALAAEHPGAAAYHFVEDRLDALTLAAQRPGLDGWDFVLVDWGYNTPEQRAQADGDPKLRVVNKRELVREFTTVEGDRDAAGTRRAADALWERLGNGGELGDEDEQDRANAGQLQRSAA